jgi:peptidoglycan hydrolase-like protein with peptidoglycan-binding domain
VTQGDTGDVVAKVQQALVAAGIDIQGGVDGAFGLATAEAVVTFQRQRGLALTGAVDEATAVALGMRKASTDPTPTTTVAVGDETAAPATPAPASGASPSDAGSLTRNLPWLMLLGLNTVLALYVRARIRAKRPSVSRGSGRDEGSEPTTTVSEQPAVETPSLP